MTEVIEVAKLATKEAKERMAANLEEAQSKLEAHIGLTKDLFEEQAADLIGDLEQIGRRKAKGSGGGAAPRPQRSEDGRSTASGAGSSSTAKASRPPRLTGGSHPTQQEKKQVPKKPAKPSPARKGG
jgi:hypothetical protein